MKRFILAAAALAVPMFASNAHALFLGYNGPISIHIQVYDAGKLYVGPNGTAAIGETNVDNNVVVQGGPMSQTGPVDGALPNEDTWGIFVIDEIFANDGSGAVLYDRASASTTLTGITALGRDTFVQIDSITGAETVHTVGSNIAVYEQAGHINFDAIAANGPTFRTNPGGIPTYAGVTVGAPIWTFSTFPGIFAGGPAFDNNDESYSTANGDFTSFASAAVTSGNGGFRAVTSTNVFGTGSQNDLFKPFADGSDLHATFGFPSQPAPAGWTVFAKDPLDATVVGVPTPSAFASGAVVLGGLMMSSLRRRRSC